MTSNKFVGTWKLLSYQFRSNDGKVVEPLGGDAMGLLTYDNAGNAVGVIVKADRKRFSSDDIGVATPDEALAALQSSIAYFGRYDVDEKNGKVTHHVVGSVFPNWTGGDQPRFFSFSGAWLTLSTPPMIVAGASVTAVLEWERIA